MTPADGQDNPSTNRQLSGSSDSTSVFTPSTNATQQGKQTLDRVMQQQNADAHAAKRIKVEHGEDSGGSSPMTSQAASPSQQQQQQQQQQHNGSNGQPGALATPMGRPTAQQMGPPLTSRPSASNIQLHSNGDAASPTAQSPSSSSAAQQPPISRTNTGPGRTPYQFGMGLPTPGINFTRTPTTGSFVVTGGSNSNSNNTSRQHTPTDASRNISRASPMEAKAGGTTTPATGFAPTSAPGAAPRKDGVDQLQDLLSISGVDLRAEEEAAQRTPMARATLNTATAAAAGQASNAPQLRQSPFFLELLPLSRQIHRIAAKNNLRVEPEVLTYISMAAKTRFQNLTEAMVASSRHRTWSSHMRPPPLYASSGEAMYHEEVHDDPQKLLAALTKIEKIEEQAARQARIMKDETEEANPAGDSTAAAGGDDGADGISSGQATPSTKDGTDDVKKTKKKLGTAATARNMSEDKRLKLANKTAAQALGIGSTGKAWMFGGAGGSGLNSPFGKKAGKGNAAGSRLPKPRFAPTAAEGGENGKGSSDGQGGDSTAGGSADYGNVSVGGWGDLAARQRRREEEEKRARLSVNLQDALHALDMERFGGAGRGSGELISYTTRALGRPPTRKM